MGELVPVLVGGAVGFGATKAVQSLSKAPEPVQAPPVPQAIEPPKATADTTEASDVARKRTRGGLIEQNIKAGSLVPITEEEKKKKKTFLG
jgi:hypothetical protein